MKRKIKTLIPAIFSLMILTSCNSKKDNLYNNSSEAFNNFFYVSMENSVVYRDNIRMYLSDFNSMNNSILCNVPNCSHSSKECISKILESSGQLPIIYNNCAYYFQNSSSFKEENGKNVLDLTTIVKKYDFKNNKITDISTIDDINVEESTGGYRIGPDYYFIASNGNPLYDEVGNVTRSGTGGGGNLLSINLENGNITDYGQVFDYEKLKEKYPSAINSTSMYLRGKTGDELFISNAYMKEETIEMSEKGIQIPYSGETYTFNIRTHQFEKLDDRFSTCSMNGYHTYFIDDNNTKLEIKDIKTGEIYDGPDVMSYNTLSVINDKVWYDSKCFDIKSGTEKEYTSLTSATAVGEYKDDYIIMGQNDKDKIELEKIPKNTFEN